MKIAFGKIVQSGFYKSLLSLRGPKGRGFHDDIRRHITEAGFEEGDDVVIITAEHYESLTGTREAE